MARLVDTDALAGTVSGNDRRTPTGGTITVTEPATGQVLAVIGRAGSDDVRTAAATARRAQPGWAATPPAARAEVLRTAERLLTEHRDEAIEWLVREGGAVPGKAGYEVDAVRDELWVAAALLTQPCGHLLPSGPERHSVARRIPLGVVGVISPWNVPMLLGMRAVAPAIALGNAVVLKPDPRTAVSGGHLVAKLFEEAGLPTGVLHVLPGGAEAGAALTRDQDVAMIAFTGSTRVGREVGAVAGGLLKRVSLELGGNNAFLVLDDADVDAAAAAGAWGAFFHQGQICMAASRHIVVESVADEYLDKLARRANELRVGDPWREEVDLGPLIDATQLDRVRRIVAESVSAGASVRAGGIRHSRLGFRPTVLADVTPTMPAFAEEIFGPVAPVTVVADEDAAVEAANRTEYGLVAAVRTGSVERGLALADRIETALVHVNDQTIYDDAFGPFGGRKYSGNGSRYGATQSWEEFTQWQWLTVQPSTTPPPGRPSAKACDASGTRSGGRSAT